MRVWGGWHGARWAAVTAFRPRSAGCGSPLHRRGAAGLVRVAWGGSNRASGGDGGVARGPRPPLPARRSEPVTAGAASPAVRVLGQEVTARARPCGGWRRGCGVPPARRGGLVGHAVHGGNGGSVLCGRLWAAIAPRWWRRACSGRGGTRSSAKAVDARHWGRWVPQPPSIAISCGAPWKRTRRWRPRLRPAAKLGGRRGASFVGHRSFASGNACL